MRRGRRTARVRREQHAHRQAVCDRLVPRGDVHAARDQEEPRQVSGPHAPLPSPHARPRARTMRPLAPRHLPRGRAFLLRRPSALVATVARTTRVRQVHAGSEGGVQEVRERRRQGLVRCARRRDDPRLLRLPRCTCDAATTCNTPHTTQPNIQHARRPADARLLRLPRCTCNTQHPACNTQHRATTWQASAPVRAGHIRAAVYTAHARTSVRTGSTRRSWTASCRSPRRTRSSCSRTSRRRRPTSGATGYRIGIAGRPGAVLLPVGGPAPCLSGPAPGRTVPCGYLTGQCAIAAGLGHDREGVPRGPRAAVLGARGGVGRRRRPRGEVRALCARRARALDRGQVPASPRSAPVR